MNVLIFVLFLIMSLVACSAIFVATRMAKRLLQLDELLELLLSDVDTNVKYFSKLLGTPTFSNSPEIITAHNNMLNILKRFNEFSISIREVTGREEKEKEELPRPVFK